MSDTLNLTVRADAPLTAAFDCLTRPELMTQWLSEFADVELPSRYRFWGRYILDGQKARQTLIAATDDTIQFEWARRAH